MLVFVIFFMILIYALFGVLVYETYSLLSDAPDAFDIFCYDANKEDLYIGILIITFWPIPSIFWAFKGIFIGLKYIYKAVVWYGKTLFLAIKSFLQKNVKITK